MCCLSYIKVCNFIKPASKCILGTPFGKNIADWIKQKFRSSVYKKFEAWKIRFYSTLMKLKQKIKYSRVFLSQ